MWDVLADSPTWLLLAVVLVTSPGLAKLLLALLEWAKWWDARER